MKPEGFQNTKARSGQKRIGYAILYIYILYMLVHKNIFCQEFIAEKNNKINLKIQVQDITKTEKDWRQFSPRDPKIREGAGGTSWSLSP